MEVAPCSTVAGDYQVEAELASQDKRCRKYSKCQHYDANVHAEIAKSACEKMLGCQIGQNVNYLRR